MATCRQRKVTDLECMSIILRYDRVETCSHCCELASNYLAKRDILHVLECLEHLHGNVNNTTLHNVERRNV